MWWSWLHFLAEWWRDFHHTGAVAPSSRFLAQAMTAVLRQPRQPWRIVEVGPGTGAVTAWILPALQAGDRLDLVEINPRFVEFLQVRFAREPLFRRCAEQVYLHPLPVQEFEPEQRADCIISGLPLNNFPAATVREILEHMERLLQPGGWLVYFEYLFIRQLKIPFVGKREKRRLYRIGRLTARFFQRHQEQRQLVWCNLPPAIVHTIQITPATCQDDQFVAKRHLDREPRPTDQLSSPPAAAP